MDRLLVHLNGRELYDVEPAADSVRSEGDLAVEFRNHGQPVHVHLRPDGALSRVTAVDGTNHYVEGETALVVEVPIEDGAAGISGALDVVTGYGKGEATVEVVLTDDEDVAVDEDLGRPVGGTADDREAADRSHEPPVGVRLSNRLRGRLPEVALPALPGAPAPLAMAARSRATLALVGLAVLALALAGVAATAASGMAVVVGIFAVLVGLAVAGYVMAR
jgi:hypothetical protein